MPKPPTYSSSGTTPGKFSRHYHQSTGTKSETSSKGRRIVEFEQKRKRNLQISVVALSLFLIATLVMLYAFETGLL